jgi:hypothetical protein
VPRIRAAFREKNTSLRSSLSSFFSPVRKVSGKSSAVQIFPDSSDEKYNRLKVQIEGMNLAQNLLLKA